MKKIALLVLSIVLTTGLLVGCGNKEVSSSSQSSPKTNNQSSNNNQSEHKEGTDNSDKKIEADPIIQQAFKEEIDFEKSHPDGYSDDEISNDFIKTHPSMLCEKYLQSKFKGDTDITDESKDIITPTSIRYVEDVEAEGKTEKHELIIELQSDKTFKVTSDKIIN